MKKLLMLLFLLIIPSISHAAWVAEDTFESYANGNDLNTLNGGSGWSAAWSAGAGKFSITNSSCYQGTLCVTETSANDNAIRTLTTAVSDGVVYFSVLRTESNAPDASFILRTGTNQWTLISFEGGNINAHGSVTTRLVTGYTTNNWYVFELTIVNTSTFSIRYSANGTTWSTSTGNLTSVNTGTVTRVEWGAGGATHTAKFDYISPTNPIAPPVVPLKSSILGLVRSFWIW